MSLENPSPAMREAVEGALDWFRATKIEGIRVEPRKGPEGDDKVVVRDPDAGPLWARFYDLKTGKPFFCGRDGIPRATLAEIDRERRTGYAWYGNWPQSLLEEAFKR
jgi:PelA/Pel-15E family pectate lyase